MAENKKVMEEEAVDTKETKAEQTCEETKDTKETGGRGSKRNCSRRKGYKERREIRKKGCLWKEKER